MINYEIGVKFDKLYKKPPKKITKVTTPHNIGEFTIYFGTQRYYDNYIVSTPVRLSFTDAQIVDEMAQKYGDLMYVDFYNDEQLIRFREMQDYIHKNLSIQDKRKIEAFFYSRRWFIPFVQFEKRFIMYEYLPDYKLIIWKGKPHIRVNMIVHFQLERMMEEYLKNFTMTSRKEAFLKQNFRITFSTVFPTILIYLKETEFRKMVLEIIQKDMNSLVGQKKSLIPLKNVWTRLLVSSLREKNVHTYQKEIKWVTNTSIEVKIMDYYKKLVEKIKGNKGKIIVGGAIALSKLRRQKKL